MTEHEPRKRSPWFTLRRITIVYALGLLVLLAAMEWWAEFWVPLAILAFAPPPILLAPLVVLLPLALLKRNWLALGIQAACVLFLVFGFMTYRFGFSNSRTAPATLTLITHNIGQGNREAFIDAFPDVTPDVILLQDVRNAHNRQRDYMARYPTFRVAPTEQFMLLSPHPVESVTQVKEALWHGKPVAARYVLDFKGRKLAVYTVHLPTPRRSLSHVLTLRTVAEMFWFSKAPTDEFPSYREWLDARITLARQLAAVLEAEKLPFVVAGDFNMPDHGVLYHTFASRFTDSHTAAGKGWGHTFPGSREGRIPALLGAWLRLDYCFAGPGWKAVESRPARDDRSQHRAVLARFQLDRQDP